MSPRKERLLLNKAVRQVRRQAKIRSYTLSSVHRKIQDSPAKLRPPCVQTGRRTKLPLLLPGGLVRLAGGPRHQQTKVRQTPPIPPDPFQGRPSMPESGPVSWRDRGDLELLPGPAEGLCRGPGCTGQVGSEPFWPRLTLLKVRGHRDQLPFPPAQTPPRQLSLWITHPSQGD